MTINRANHTWPEDVMRCNQCEALMINGVFCHETGCPNTRSRYDEQSGEWIKQYKCFHCGCDADVDSNCCADEFEEESDMEFERRQRGSASTLAALFVVALFAVCAIAVFPMFAALANVAK